VKESKDINRIFLEITEDLKHLYMISYHAPPVDSGENWRKIDLVVNGVTVLATGAKATGTIVEGRKKKALFGRGKVTYRLDTVQTVDGKQIRIRAASVAGSSAAMRHPLDVPGTKSKDMAAERGAHFLGYIDGDVSVTSQK